MQSVMTPICLARVVETEPGSRTRRAPRCRSGVVQRSMGGVGRAHRLLARCCAAGLPPAAPPPPPPVAPHGAPEAAPGPPVSPAACQAPTLCLGAAGGLATLAARAATGVAVRPEWPGGRGPCVYSWEEGPGG